MKYVLIGDGESPHLLKWAKELSKHVDLWVVSSRGFLSEYSLFIDKDRMFSFNEKPNVFGWILVFFKIFSLGKWLRCVDADCLNPHYLTSHGLLVILVKRLFGLRGFIVGSAWGSDVLIFPEKGLIFKKVFCYIVAQCRFTTSDSLFVAKKMKEMGSKEVMVFPFGIQKMPAISGNKNDNLFFSNRGLEDIYNPFRVLSFFENIFKKNNKSCLIIANTGSLLTAMKSWVEQRNLTHCINFVGKLDADKQSIFYENARWFISLPHSDAVSVSIIEAMSHGCIPIVSNLPANHELINHQVNGFILEDDGVDEFDCSNFSLNFLDSMSELNKEWVKNNALFPTSIEYFLNKVNQMQQR